LPAGNSVAVSRRSHSAFGIPVRPAQRAAVEFGGVAGGVAVLLRCAAGICGCAVEGGD